MKLSIRDKLEQLAVRLEELDRQMSDGSAPLDLARRLRRLGWGARRT